MQYMQRPRRAGSRLTRMMANASFFQTREHRYMVTEVGLFIEVQDGWVLTWIFR